MESITLTTKDDVTLVGHYYPGTTTKGILFLHQLASSKESWNNLIEELEDYHILALDLRGHGESEQDFGNFHEQDFSNMTQDVDAAITFLKKHVQTLAVIGASIGANLALKSTIKKEITTAILLSPGINYRGINIAKDISKDIKPTLIMVGMEDQYSYESSKRIMNELTQEKKLVEYNTQLHGTNLLRQQNTKEEIITWLTKHL